MEESSSSSPSVVIDPTPTSMVAAVLNGEGPIWRQQEEKREDEAELELDMDLDLELSGGIGDELPEIDVMPCGTSKEPPQSTNGNTTTAETATQSRTETTAPPPTEGPTSVSAKGVPAHPESASAKTKENANANAKSNAEIDANAKLTVNAEIDANANRNANMNANAPPSKPSAKVPPEQSTEEASATDTPDSVLAKEEAAASENRNAPTTTLTLSATTKAKYLAATGLTPNSLDNPIIPESARLLAQELAMEQQKHRKANKRTRSDDDRSQTTGRKVAAKSVLSNPKRPASPSSALIVIDDQSRQKKVAAKSVLPERSEIMPSASAATTMTKKARKSTDESRGSYVAKAPAKSVAAVPTENSKKSQGRPPKAKSGKAKPTAKSSAKVPAKADSQAHTSSKSKIPKQKTDAIWSGPPDEPLEGGWPEGWIKRVYRRRGGKTQGTHDRYWFSPKTQKKFRSMKEIGRFLPLLQQCRGNEEEAWMLFKAGK